MTIKTIVFLWGRGITADEPAHSKPGSHYMDIITSLCSRFKKWGKKIQQHIFFSQSCSNDQYLLITNYKTAILYRYPTWAVWHRALELLRLTRTSTKTPLTEYLLDLRSKKRKKLRQRYYEVLITSYVRYAWIIYTRRFLLVVKICIQWDNQF